MVAELRGPVKKTCTVDEEGHRTYKVTDLVVTDDVADGPAIVLQCPDLPANGTAYGLDNDSDPWAYKLAVTSIQQVVSDEPGFHWHVESTWSTKPPQNDKSRCQDTEIKDPLLEPFKVTGGFSKYQEEATFDRYFNPIRNSCLEPIRGPQVEFDKPRSSVKISMNVPVLNLPLLTAMNNTVNDRELWGLPARCIKLQVGNWERKFYGFCNIYYVLPLEFDIQYDGFDRTAQDYGSKLLKGHWGVLSRGETEGQWYVDLINGLPPDPQNPGHFIQAKDPKGEAVKGWVLNGQGLPAGVTVLPTPTVIVADVTFSNNINPTIAAQPPNPTKLSVFITDPNNFIAEGFCFIVGTDDTDTSITEKIDIADAGTLEYLTQQTFKTVTQVQMGGTVGGFTGTLFYIDPGSGLLQSIFPAIALTNGLMVKITTATRKTTEASISIEKYGQSNFLLLGIPIIF